MLFQTQLSSKQVRLLSRHIQLHPEQFKDEHTLSSPWLPQQQDGGGGWRKAPLNTDLELMHQYSIQSFVKSAHKQSWATFYVKG